MKTFFLIPPSEWKQKENIFKNEILSFKLEKPLNIANKVSEKDLKCSWDRFIEWLELNKNILNSNTNYAINRYSWVMFDSIDYNNMTNKWKEFFEENFFILSWMYGLLKPLDKIWNYKLPIETKWLYDFWWDKIIKNIIILKPDYIINLLPISYNKMLWFNKNKDFHNYWIKIVNINFLKSDGKKISHWVKKIKWEWIKNICEKWIKDYNDFWWNIRENWNIIEIDLIN